MLGKGLVLVLMDECSFSNCHYLSSIVVNWKFEPYEFIYNSYGLVVVRLVKLVCLNHGFKF